MTGPFARRGLLHVLGAACICLAVVALAEAASWYEHPVAGMFVDPGGVVSNFGLPSWEAKQRGVKFPDAVVAVDGRLLLSSRGTPRAKTWDDAVDEAWKEHHDGVDVILRTSAGSRSLRLGVHPLEPTAWWIFAGSLVFAGVLYVAAGLIALWVSPQSALARTFGKVGLFTGTFIGTLFDFHTTRLLCPLFFTAYAMVPVSWVALALRLPDDAPILSRTPWLEKGLYAVGAAAAATFLFFHWSGRETLVVQQIWAPALPGAFVFFGIAFVVRLAKARGTRRDRLRALMWSVVPPHIAIGALVLPFLRGTTAEAISYATLSLFPLATAYAFIRYDLWGSRALLSRILTRVGVAALSTVVAIAGATALAAQTGVPFSTAFVAASLGAGGAVVLVLVALGAVDRRLFPSRMKYKPTVEQLSEELISITSPTEVARAVERTIRRWLPCELVALSLEPQQSAPDASGLRLGSAASLEDADRLTLPVEFGGVRLGSLNVGEKVGSALFTRDDADLLRTIANQGALALAHAYAYQELEARRREQAAAWQGERAALVETVAAEIAHEVRYPINFFRTVFEHPERPLVADDFAIGQEEVERLERLVSGLRRLAGQRMERRRVGVSELCDRVERLLRDTLGERRLQRTLPQDLELFCDFDQVVQILVNLVANGLQAAGETGTVGVCWSQGARGSELTVWDTGPGFEGDPARLFAPWYSTKPNGTGLGLAIAHRFVRAHGWSIAAQRRDNRTLFVIAIRAEDVAIRGTTTDDSRPTKVA